MKAVNILQHLLIGAAGIFLILVVPFLKSGYLSTALSGGTDVVSSASAQLDSPSGEFVVLINRDMHTDPEKMDFWISFFTGEEVSFVFEDITCSVSSSDSGAIDMANKFLTKLGQNQMTLKTENSTLLLSRADNSKFDIIIMSKEFAEQNCAETAYGDNVEVLEVKGGDVE